MLAHTLDRPLGKVQSRLKNYGTGDLVPSPNALPGNTHKSGGRVDQLKMLNGLIKQLQCLDLIFILTHTE